MKCLYRLSPVLPALLCLLLIAGCTGMSGDRLPPVVDRGEEIPGQSPDAAPAPAHAPEPEPDVLPGEGGRAMPARTRQPEPPAVVALLEHAEQQANAGDLDAAAVTLERAIRIDSRNPVLWHHLATVRLAEGEPLEAEQLAAKSNSLAAGNPALQARNWTLIAQARRSRGDTPGARAAERQANSLEKR